MFGAQILDLGANTSAKVPFFCLLPKYFKEKMHKCLYLVRKKRHLCRFFLLEAFQSCDILAENIEFYIHHGSYFDVAEVGVLSGVRDDGYGEGVVGWLADGE